MDKIKVWPVDEVNVRIECEQGIKYELSEAFTFKVPGYRFNPKYRNKMWDGNIRLFNLRTSLIYKGLIEEIKTFANNMNYTVEFMDGVVEQNKFTVEDAKQFYDLLKLPDTIEERDFQLESLSYCIQNNRSLFVSPTGSGKSLIIYMLLKFYMLQKHKVLIIVDSLNLLNQMFSDFKEYGFDSDKLVHTICAGSDKNSDKPIIVSTWQSAAKQPENWFKQYGVVIGDEAHKYKAKELTKIMTNLKSCKYRFGFTGSLDGTTTNKLVLQGLFGAHKQLVTTKQLQDDGTLAQLNINCIILKYPKDDCKLMRKATWMEETKFIVNNPKRNNFICKLTLSLKGNTLLLFRFVEEHGEPLYKYLKSKSKNDVYYVSGKVKGSEREDTRKLVIKNENSIIVASTGVFSTGINIPNLNNIIFAAPTKSQIMTLQSVGRGLRKTKDKDKCVIYDIADDLISGKKENHTYKHFKERLRIYNKENFNYKLYKVDL